MLGSFYTFSQFQNIKLALKPHHVSPVVRRHDVNTRQVTWKHNKWRTWKMSKQIPDAITFSG